MYTQSFSPSLRTFNALKHPIHQSRAISGQPHLQTGRTQPNGPGLDANERFLRVVDRQLLDKLEQAIGTESPSFGHLTPDDFTPERIADRVLGLVNRALGRLQDSQPGFDKEAFLSRVEEGIDTGFQEARDILGDMGVLSGQIEDSIDATYARIQEGLGKLETLSLPSDEVSLAVQSRSTELNKSVQIEIMTHEGDIIKIGLQHSLSASQSSFMMEQERGGISAFESEFASRSDLTVTVEGDLNEDEQASIQHLLKQMDKVRNAFFKGNVQAAFHHAAKLGIDGNTLAGATMDLEMSRSVQAIAAYQQTRLMEQSVQSGSLKQASDFFSRAHEMLQTVRSALISFENPLSAFYDLYDAVHQANRMAQDETELEGADTMMDQLIKPLGQSILVGEQSTSA